MITRKNVRALEALTQLITTIDTTNSNIGVGNTPATDGSISNSVLLGDGQNVGVGTSTPLVGLHLGTTGATVPAVYLADATSETLPTIGANDGVFSVLAGTPTFTNASGAKTLFSLSSEDVGTATLVAGTVTISSSIITTNSLVLITRTTTTGDVTTIGTLSVASRTAGVSFTVDSTVITDVGNFDYMVINF